jgi:CheY-like chemotaxis protein
MPSNPVVVLVVEDDPDVREVLTLGLEHEGMTVIDAATGGEALRILGGDPTIAILVTDIMMPGITGITLAERAAALRPDLKILFISAYPAVGQPPGLLLSKPFHLSELLAALRSRWLET